MADRDVAVCTAAEDVLRVAEARTRKPLGSRHLARGEHTLVRLVLRVLLDVDAAEGLALAAPLLRRRLPGARVTGAGAVLRHPAAAALLVRVLERGHRRAVRALTFAVLLDRGVVGLGKRPLSFRPRALQRVRKLRAPDLSPLRQLRHGPPPLY